MKKKIFRRSTGILMAMVMLMSMTACSRTSEQSQESGNSVQDNNVMSSVEAEAVTGQEISEEFVDSTASFAIELFKNSVEADELDGNNVLISPESVLTALALTINGAVGETRDEMLQVMAGGIEIEDFNQQLYTYNNILTESEMVAFNIANSLWIKDNKNKIIVHDDFLVTDKSYYDADVFLDLFDSEAVDRINSWVSESTDDMIPEIVDEIDNNTVMYLINAITFEGNWSVPYTDDMVDENGVFNCSDGTSSCAAMLSSDEGIYVNDDLSTGFVKEYEGGEFAFMAILPSEDVTVEEYVSQMSAESFLDMYSSRSYETVITKTPEFTYDYDMELSDSLKAMGMTNAFERTADFTSMADTPENILYISRVLHKTHIELNRNGTKAAAVTAIEMKNDTCMVLEDTPKEVILDRPFIYAIIETSTGLPVFIGVVNEIE